MITRLAVMLSLAAVCGWGQAETAVTLRLKEEFKEAHPYVPLPAKDAEAEVGSETTIKLEPMTVTVSRAFTVDVLAEARRAAAVREAAQFSLLKGGTLFSSRRGDLGFWPVLVPVNATPVKKGDAMISVDLLRLKW